MLIGLDCVVQRNTGTYASPTWSAITTISEVTVSAERGKADVSTRGSGGWKMEKGTLKSLSLEFDIKDKNGDTEFNAIREAYLNGTQLDLAVTDLPIATSGAEGFRAYFEVESISRKEPLEDAVVYSVKLFLGYNAQGPVWISTT